ncbi:MAG: cell division protein FtsA [Oligoflexales bacterium]|nr:cell division protein FtsA [Oligoflexales bacterium]
MKSNNIFALDLGTTKFCFGNLKYNTPGCPPSIETISVNAGGMRRGMLTDFDKAKQSLLTLIDIAETEFNTNISKVVVGIAGSHLQSNIFKTKIPVQNQIVKESTLETLKHDAMKQKPSFHKENLHAIPLSYFLDDREPTNSPEGFSADFITGKFFRIEADKHYLNDVINLCNHCGLEVKNLYAEPYASACATLSEEEKKYGVMIADIGGGTTDGIIFHQGLPTRLFTINIGGMLMTHDLAIGLGIPFETAEHLKLSVGLDRTKLNQKISVNNLQDKETLISNEDLYMILFSRVLELSTLLKQHLDAHKLPLKSGLVLTGGGSDVQGLEQMMSYILKIPVRKTLPNPCKQLNIDTMDQKAFEQRQLASKYSTVSGMLILEQLMSLKKDPISKHGVLEKYFHNFVSWVKELS